MKTWEMKKTVYSVSDFVQWQQASLLELSPSFQRRPVWKAGAKSFLLDTIIRGLPMPIIFLRDRKANLGTLKTIKEVVDGQQRIRTLISYVSPKSLKDFDNNIDSFSITKAHNKEYAGKSFALLPDDVRQRILDYQFSVHVMPSGVDDREVLQIFARMNATGVKLNDQELRNAEYFGEFKTCMYELASEQLNRWRSWKIFTEYNIARMEEVELMSEFAMLLLKGVSGKTQQAIDAVYEDKDEEFPEEKELAHRIRQVFNEIEEQFGDDLAGSPFSRKTLFYSLFAAVYQATFGGESIKKKAKLIAISPNRVKLIKKRGDNIRNDAAPESVLNSVRLRTTHISSRKAVVGYLTKA